MNLYRSNSKPDTDNKSAIQSSAAEFCVPQANQYKLNKARLNPV